MLRLISRMMRRKREREMKRLISAWSVWMSSRVGGGAVNGMIFLRFRFRLLSEYLLIATYNLIFLPRTAYTLSP